MPLRNRVDPFGAIHAVADRGTMYGNRGGRFHRDDGTLKARAWASDQWLCCVLAFKGRKRRPLMGRGYTELFFLDEVTALAAGHRPCFECRRADAVRFAANWARAKGLSQPPKAPEMDALLQTERVDGLTQRAHRGTAADLPDGAMFAVGGRAFAMRNRRALPWSFAGYGDAVALPAGEVSVLTPPTMVAVLRDGFEPGWHPSAG
ncbi:hypothetical protein E8L99_09575 [Phreatobacter aquaticus]|uniref:Uncharacterized protein n=1 Tax=Phreatobacter aquaticus TaxID=2570229 RepID=A0A4D7QFN9_9HYPH|nr:hypothetical protein [Phreatobacter aquaticus]QCK85988.1 hypothetical protein E8L99_09575 [Phreatobacter aquaticus]